MAAYAAAPVYGTTSVKDRTAEFHAVLSKCAATQRAAPPVPRAQNAHSEFTRRAQSVARDLGNTTAKLSRLSQLARRKTLFDDRPVEISELTYIIKHDIAGLNRQLAELQAYATPGRGQQNRAEEHRGNVVAMLQTNLASTTTSFQEILEVRTQNMKASKDRSEQILQNPAPLAAEQQRTQSPLYNLARSSSAAASRAPPSNVLHNRAALASPGGRQDEETGPKDGFLALDMMNAPPASAQQQQQQVLLHDFEEQQSSYMQQRSTAIESIESTISELGQIFGQLAHMVAQQGETVQRIDDDVVHVVDHVEGAQRELLKYYASIANNRWLILKIFGVLIVFFLLFILIS